MDIKLDFSVIKLVLILSFSKYDKMQFSEAGIGKNGHSCHVMNFNMITDYNKLTLNSIKSILMGRKGMAKRYTFESLLRPLQHFF